MKKFIYLLLIFCSLVTCGQVEQKKERTKKVEADSAINKTQLATEIRELEGKLLQIQDAKKDTVSAIAMIEKTELYVQHFPKDSLSPYLLFRAGDVARGAKKTEKAIVLWESVWKNYRIHPIAPQALFAQAFTYDAQLGNSQEAEKYYRKFTDLYPKHKLMPQVQALLKSVKKSPTELVKEFEKQN